MRIVLSGSFKERGQLLVAWCSFSLASPAFARFSLAVRLRIGAAAAGNAVLVIRFQSDSVISRLRGRGCSTWSVVVRGGCEVLVFAAVSVPGGSICMGVGWEAEVLLFGRVGDEIGDVRLRGLKEAREF